MTDNEKAIAVEMTLAGLQFCPDCEAWKTCEIYQSTIDRGKPKICLDCALTTRVWKTRL